MLFIHLSTQFGTKLGARWSPVIIWNGSGVWGSQPRQDLSGEVAV